MRKQLLLTLVLVMGSAYADNEAQERAKDHVQPTPNASVTTQAVTEQTTVVESEQGTEINSTRAVSIDNSEAGQLAVAEESASELILPEGQIINNQMDLQQTIDKMQSAFKALQGASSTSAMQAQANTLTEYAGQAQALLAQDQDQMQLSDPEQIMADIKQLRGLLVELNAALDTGDVALAKTKVDVIAQAQDGFYRHFTPQ
ncbi:hypothetical protein KRX19_02825 [Cardiobacteriaceae bacterium TAE3-ERU3]|nr:hypothetical protein [Cardiobacteriaceae bacterium TAE3-ERU3]